jgi:hypothetical protein
MRTVTLCAINVCPVMSQNVLCYCLQLHVVIGAPGKLLHN